MGLRELWVDRKSGMSSSCADMEPGREKHQAAGLWKTAGTNGYSLWINQGIHHVQVVSVPDVMQQHSGRDTSSCSKFKNQNS